MNSNIPSRSARAVQVATTSMPFLYQTKTLCNAPPFRQQALRQLLYSRPRSRCLHSSCHRQARDYDNSSNNNFRPSQSPSGAQSEDNQESVHWQSNFTIRKQVIGRHDHEKKATKAEDDIPWDSRHTAPRSASTSQDELPFDNYTYDSESYGMDDSSDPSFNISSAAPGESTITLEERRAFEGIFTDIYTKAQSGQIQLPSFSSGQKINPKLAMQELEDILNEVAELEGDFTSASGADEGEEQTVAWKASQSDVRRGVAEYPKALRAVAAQALGLGQRRQHPEAVEEEPSALEKAQEVLREAERERILALLAAAKTDVELWEVMEKEVFSLVSRLGLAESHPPAAPTKGKKGKKSAKSAEASKPEERSKLDLATYSPLYPTLLAHSLHLLTTSFTRPSPLSLNVLPRIKSLGLASHILGASSELYNTLLDLHLNHLNTHPVALTLLHEMLRSGIPMDSTTYSLVASVILQKSAVVRSGQMRRKTEEERRSVWKEMGVNMSPGMEQVLRMPEFFGRRGWGSDRKIEAGRWNMLGKKVKEEVVEKEGPRVARKVVGTDWHAEMGAKEYHAERGGR